MLDERHLELIQQLFETLTEKMDKLDATLIKQIERSNKMELEQVRLDGANQLHSAKCPLNKSEIERVAGDKAYEVVDELRQEIADKPKTRRQKFVDYAIIIGCIIGIATFILGVVKMEKMQDENNALKNRIEEITKEK